MELWEDGRVGEKIIINGMFNNLVYKPYIKNI
jgi:hypothetical protein